MNENIVYILIVLVGILILAIIALLFFFIKKKSDGDESDLQEIMRQEMVENMLVLKENLRSIKEDIHHNARNFQDNIREQNRDINANVKLQFTESQKLISDITKEITEVKEGNKQVLNMTEQLSNLEKVLTNQKQRGNWGESTLDLILSNFINGNYTMQYKFENGEIVDAVIHIKNKLLPIDSKFSLDNYQRAVDAENEEDRKFFAEEFKKDLKLRVTETAKYIREKENTLSIAFMFIPSEAIYYDLLAGENSRIKVNTQKLLEYAQSQRIFIVSATSLIAYLHLVIAGIQAFNTEKNSEKIKGNVEQLSKHINTYEEYMKKLGSSMDTTVNHYNSAYKELKKIDKDVYKITDGTNGGSIEPILIEKTSKEE